ncbi:MAG TPA: hypothetical protein VK808_01340 [Bacteroidia bacterium]|jgi:hypothetical protein|nr:hypothetical protein [Bacteroidia bacterium]
MKKISLILLGAILSGGFSFASPVVKQDKAQTKTEKKVVKSTGQEKKAGKMETKTTKKGVKAAR